MRYEDTWFNKHPMTHKGSTPHSSKIYWTYHYVDVLTGDIVGMSRQNEDGSIDVLGVNILRLSSGITFGTYNLEKEQESLAEHAEQLKAAGATIIKHTKNRLVARYGKETAYYVISPLSVKTFYKAWRNEQ
jgi:hypothetical protein